MDHADRNATEVVLCKLGCRQIVHELYSSTQICVVVCYNLDGHAGQEEAGYEKH